MNTKEKFSLMRLGKRLQASMEKDPSLKDLVRNAQRAKAQALLQTFSASKNDNVMRLAEFLKNCSSRIFKKKLKSGFKIKYRTIGKSLFKIQPKDNFLFIR